MDTVRTGYGVDNKIGLRSPATTGLVGVCVSVSVRVGVSVRVDTIAPISVGVSIIVIWCEYGVN
jgi:hypothetical protein